MGGSTNFPSNFANVRGIPMIPITSVEVTDTNVVMSIPAKAFRGLSNSGIVAVKLNQETPAGGAALPVLFSSADYTQGLTVLGNTAATGADITAVGVYLVWYDKAANVLQLLTYA